MSFVTDPHRARLHDNLRAAIDEALPSVTWVVGAPGVGKTRAVLEFFERSSELQHRVRVTEDWERLLDWCRRSSPVESDLVVIVDEVPPDRARDLARSFKSRASRTHATLVLIGTQGGLSGGTPAAFGLEGVEPNAFRELIETELGRRDPSDVKRTRVVELVEALAQGYPLFAMWLTRGLAENPELLQDPGDGLTNQADPWTATKLVLASRSHDAARWDEVAEARGRALLLAMLVPTDRRVEATEEGMLATGLGRDWAALTDAQHQCRERGILRATRYGLLYISPANLERLLLNHYFGRKPPPIDPERLRERVGSRMDRLLTRARDVGASEACREALARASLEPTLVEVEQGAQDGGNLLWIAREIPAEVVRRAHPLAIRVSDLSDETTGARLSEVFRHLRHRALSRSDFELVEDALFALAYRQRDKQRVASADDWASIFSSGLHATHQAFDFRLSLLRRRLDSSDRHERLAALDGVGSACDPDDGRGLALNSGLDDLDQPATGEWLGPDSMEEVVRRSACGWDLLLQAAEDAEHEVADRARRAIASRLRSGVRGTFIDRPGIVESIAMQAAGWTASQRNELGSALEDVNRYDRAYVARAPDLSHALDAVKRAVAPTSLIERVLLQVGRWDPVPGPITADDRQDAERRADFELARELLRDPSVLWASETWLDSAEAVRVSSLGYALGEADNERKLLPSLLAAIHRDALSRLTTSYLAAWAAGDENSFDAWAASALIDESLDNTLAHALCWGNASGFRVRCLATLVRRGRVEAASLRGIGYWDWAKPADVESLDDLIAALLGDGRREVVSQAVGLSRQRLAKHPNLDEPFADLLVQLLDGTRSGHLAATAERDWAMLVRELVAAGRLDVLRVAVQALDDRGYSHQVERAVVELIASGHAEPLWKAVLEGLTERPARAATLERVLSRDASHNAIPTDKILEWVGTDEERGVLAARFTQPYSRELDPLAESLVDRFGAESRVAGAVSGRVGTTPTSVSSFAGFFEKQAINAEAWASAHAGETGRWAADLAARLTERCEAEREEEALWRRHG